MYMYKICRHIYYANFTHAQHMSDAQESVKLIKISKFYMHACTSVCESMFGNECIYIAGTSSHIMPTSTY